MADIQDRELAWDAEIENDGQDFVILPVGEYPFRVLKVERTRSKGSEKMNPCNMARVTIEVGNAEVQTTIEHHLVLNAKLEWKLSEFFRAIGQKQHGKKIQMDWSKAPGSTGTCKVGHRKWTGRDGKEMVNNEITKFIDAENPTNEAKDDLAF